MLSLYDIEDINDRIIRVFEKYLAEKGLSNPESDSDEFSNDLSIISDSDYAWLNSELKEILEVLGLF